MYFDEGNKKDLNFQFANIIGLLDLKTKLRLVSAIEDYFYLHWMLPTALDL